jgi:hypothetical protein
MKNNKENTLNYLTGLIIRIALKHLMAYLLNL